MKHLTLLFLLRDSRVLLAMKKRGFGEGRWNGVGGKVDGNETIEQAMLRECQEEIRVTPLVFKNAGEITFNEFVGNNTSNLQVHVFTCTQWQGEPIETEEMAPLWFDMNDLPLKDMWSDDAYWLPQVLSGKRINAEFTLDENDEIVDYAVKEL